MSVIVPMHCPFSAAREAVCILLCVFTSCMRCRGPLFSGGLSKTTYSPRAKEQKWVSLACRRALLKTRRFRGYSCIICFIECVECVCVPRGLVCSLQAHHCTLCCMASSCCSEDQGTRAAGQEQAGASGSGAVAYRLLCLREDCSRRCAVTLIAHSFSVALLKRS